MLVQFAVIAFALFGLAALTVDMGLARLTQAQMQTAADSAAIEGLRLRNQVGEDGFASDCTRRAAARDLVRRTFDDDLDLSGDPRSFGAGPTFDVLNGQGDADAFGLLTVDENDHAYKPRLQLNQATNAVSGDMVSGTFTYGPSPFPDEAADYGRTDFAPNGTPPLPGASGLAACPDDVIEDWRSVVPQESGAGALGAGDEAFLVRLRRTTDPDGLDNVPDESSSGPPIPWLFGRGTMIHTDPASGSPRNARRDGVTVRATAIAGTASALAVGVPVGPLLGATPFYLTRDFFQSLTDDPTTTPPATIEPDGAIAAATTVPCALPGLSSGHVGAFTDIPLTQVAFAPGTIASTAPAPPMKINGLVPVVECVGTGPRVVGFGRVELLWNSEVCPTTACFTRGVLQLVASANATRLLPGGLHDPLAPISPADALLVMQANQTFSDSGFGLLVPSLVR